MFLVRSPNCLIHTYEYVNYTIPMAVFRFNDLNVTFIEFKQKITFRVQIHENCHIFVEN